MNYSQQKPLISIITPTLNNKKKLLELITNIRKQSYTNYEHIIADGGSNDGTIEYLKTKN